MKRIRLAVFFDQQIRAGGGYQQALNAALLTRELPAELVDILFFTTLKENISALSKYGIKAKLIRLTLFDKALIYFRRLALHQSLLKVIRRINRFTPFEKYFFDENIDLVYFLVPTPLARDLEELNYITTVWDLSHRDDPEFPEVRWNRALEARDRNYQAILPRATAIFVDSELGKINTVNRYGVNAERVHIMPFQSSVSVREYKAVDINKKISIAKKYQLNVPYIFYPAQFWAHKNHIYLLEGLSALEQSHCIKIGAIFSGGDQGNRAHVEKHMRLLGLEERVRFAGFVENEEVPELYLQSVALVMPTYFGPTNLPPLEAFELGVPVLYSNKAGLVDQVGQGALLMDLNNPNSMAHHLKNLIDNKDFRAQIIQAGSSQLENLKSIDRVAIMRSVLEDFRWRRICWE